MHMQVVLLQHHFKTDSKENSSCSLKNVDPNLEDRQIVEDVNKFKIWLFSKSENVDTFFTRLIKDEKETILKLGSWLS